MNGLTAPRARSAGGFSLVELLVTLAILGVLAGLAMPLAELTYKREQERLLRRALNEIRDAIDAYKRAVDEGRIVRSADQSGYPPSLETLVEGVPDARSTSGGRLVFLRRVPRDPFAPAVELPPARTWGIRSHASTAWSPREGTDVYDVHSLAPGRGLNGVPYREW